MIYSHAELHEMLARVGAGIHIVDGSELFCRVRGPVVEPGEFDRVMRETQDLVYIEGDTFLRHAHNDIEVDGKLWSIAGVRLKSSGIVVLNLERELS